MSDKVNATWGEFRILGVSGRQFVYLQLILVLSIFYLTTALRIPPALTFICDIVTVCACVCMGRGASKRLIGIGYRQVLLAFQLFVFVVAVSMVFGRVDPWLVVWAVRNNFRFFAFFAACALLLVPSDIPRIMTLLLRAQVVNVGVSLYQYFVLGLRQDELGGIFGVGSGANGYSNVLFCALLCFYALKFVEGETSFATLSFVATSTLGLSALAELKVFYFEFAAILVVAVASRLSRVRSAVLLICGLGAFGVSLNILRSEFPNAYRMLTSTGSLGEYSTVGMAAYEIPRIGAFNSIDQLIFQGDWTLRLLGLGFGSAEYSSVDLFSSGFYETWGFLNYRWFASQMWMIETGLLGFGSFVLVFLAHAWFSAREMMRTPRWRAALGSSLVMTILTIVGFWYNSGIRVEAAYLTAAVLSFPCVLARERVGKGSMIDLER